MHSYTHTQDYALVYLSPEKLEVNQDLLRRIWDTVGIACFAVDECVRVLRVFVCAWLAALE